MDPEYQETTMLLPKNLAVLLSLMLVATWVSMLVTKLFYYTGMPSWMLYIAAAVFAVIIFLCFWMSLSVAVYADRVDIRYVVKTTSIPMEQVIDTKTGEINIIKNYAGWNLKGVKYRTYSVIGEDMGIGLKLTGKRVCFLSTKDPSAIAALLPKEAA